MTGSLPIVDQWTYLAHKRLLSDRPGDGGWRPASWVPTDDARRLAAYYMLDLYRRNAARHLLAHRDAAAEHTEYGDPDLLVRRLVAGVTGDATTITVDGSGEVPDMPDVAPEPQIDDLGHLPESARQAVHARRLARWADEAADAVAEWDEAVAAAPVARRREAELREWAARRQLVSRLHESEVDAVGLGDSVVVLWPEPGDWPTASVLDPAAYFPDVADADRDEFPRRVDIAWTFTEPDPVTGAPESFLRRCTWELVDLTGLHTVEVNGPDGPRLSWADATGAPASSPTLRPGEVQDSGRVMRSYPWHGDDDDLSPDVCLYTEMVWAERDLTGDSLRSLDESLAVVIHDRTDLGVDFIPVIHRPNTPTSQTMWGTSALAPVAQVFDDLATADTDAMQASRYLSDPTLALFGAEATDRTIAPGTVLGVTDPAGKMMVLDLSVGMDRLMAHGDRLQGRLWQNAGVPRELLGHGGDGAAVSGVALALRFAPYASLIATLRLPREHKNGLILKFAQRLAQAAGVLEPGPTPAARITPGSFLPTDRAETVSIVTDALGARAISTRTAVALLVAAGFPVDDAADEVERIRAENPTTYTNAVALAEALASEQAAAEYLGVEAPRPVDLP